MIFGAALLPKVLDGSKTETRRRQRDGEVLSRYRPGHDYAVQARRRGRAIARLLVSDVRSEQLIQLSEQAARAEGFEDRAGFETYWRQLYREYDPYTRVWVIHFALFRPCIYCARQTTRLFSIAAGQREAACDEDHIAAWLREQGDGYTADPQVVP